MALFNSLSFLSTVGIRKATLEDARRLAALSRMTFVEAFGESNTQEDMQLYVQKAFNPGQIRSELADPANTFFLAFEKGNLVAYAKLRTGHTPEEIKNENAIEIERFYVRKSMIGKNVSKPLMKACINFAKERNFETVWLGVWEYNPRAIHFYEKWGFEKFGTHIFTLGYDEQTDLLMKKKL